MPKQEYKESITGFRRVNQFADDTLADKIEMSDFVNGVLDKDGGKAVKRDAFRQVNAGNQAPNNALYDLHEFVPSDGKDYIVAKNKQNIIKSKDGSSAWQQVTTVNANRVNYANYINNLFITSESDLKEVQDLDSGKVFDLQVAPPDDSVFDLWAGLRGGDCLTLDSTYYYVLIFKLKNGSFSLPSRTRTIYIDDTGAVESGLLRTTADYPTLDVNAVILNKNTSGSLITDDRVQSLLLYRTLASNPSVFYFVSVIEDRNDNSKDWYLDFAPDTALPLSDRVPAIDQLLGAKYPLVHKNRLFLANIGKKNNYPYMLPVNVGQVASAPTDPDLASQVLIATLYKPFTAVSSFQPVPGEWGLEVGKLYKYKAFLTNETGIISKSLDWEVTIGSGHNVVTVTNIDWNVYKTELNTGVKFDVYRTKGDGSTYYLVPSTAVSSILNSGSSNFWEDATPDSLLVTELDESGIVDTSLLIFSEQNKPNEFRTINSIPVKPDELNPITGLVEINEGILIFKQNSIERLITQGLPSQNWTVDNISNQLGCDMPDSIVTSKLGVYFMKKNKIYRYPDRMFEPISSARKDDIDDIALIYHSAYITSKNWVVFAYGDGLLIYDEIVDAWYIHGEKPSTLGYGYNYATLYGRRL